MMNNTHPDSLIRIWEGAYEPLSGLYASHLKLGKVQALEEGLFRWDGGETYVWDRETRQTYLPGVMAEREQCARYYLGQLQQALDEGQAETVEMDAFISAVRWLWAINPARFDVGTDETKKIGQDIRAMQAFWSEGWIYGLMGFGSAGLLGR